MRKVKYKRLDQASMAAPHEDKSGEETVPTKSVDILTNSQDLEKSDSANFEVDTKSTGFSIGNQSSEVDSDQRLQPIEQTFANLSI